MDPRAPSWTAALRALATAGAAGVSAVGLGRLAAAALTAAPAPDALVGAVVLALGALAAAALAVGCAMLGATSCAAAAGRRWTRTEAVAASLVPLVLRRTLTLGIGAGLTLGLGPAALADEVDVGWAVTTGSTAQPAAAGPADATPDTSTQVGAGHPGIPTAPTAVVPATATSALGATPDAAPAGPPTVTTHGAPPTTVTVQAGDSLWSITASLLPEECDDAQVAAAWPLLYAANLDLVGPDPGLIHPGDVLTVPAEVTA